ncbi:competence protein ComEA [Clavibacter michiganensis]|uniref:ComEA family DNA-binding protein n=1 Tax=Clavibacter michiganensis TaxID=28447 RepID=UPI001D55451C|nr:ComEA family DNA-binding protein [Clavibacter michiganensis]MBM7410725.1 competence protein ComEA [Clavibacter michiganensis]
MRVRLRVGVGAAAVLVGAALVVTILVTAVQSAGEASPTAPAAARPSSAAHAGTGVDASDEPAHGDAAGDAGDEDAAAGDEDAAGAGDADGGGSGSADGARTPIYVHVVGAVASPGLYPLAPGSRVVDALAAAHGFAAGADTAGVNLARVLSDGEQLVVPRQGEAPTASAAPAGSAGGVAGSASPSAPVDLNTATAEQLETLPRVGPSLAARIIAWRSAHGRFARVADLGRVPGIGDRTLASLTPLVRV